MDCYWVLDAGADDLRILMFVTYDTSCPNDVFYIHDAGSGCGGTRQTLTATETFQYLSSPSFPSQYPSDSSCRWTINNALGTVDIEVVISDIEDGDPAVCDYDHYEIYDGLTINFELMLGFIGGSLLLICMTIIIVVCVVTKAKPPSGKHITPVQPFRPYETVDKNSIRIRMFDGYHFGSLKYMYYDEMMSTLRIGEVEGKGLSNELKN
uniref:Tolloid-like protein 2 n=1 Tax=Magallana gigas TaxID=29159 RepID=K1PPF8_MAGGI